MPDVAPAELRSAGSQYNITGGPTRIVWAWGANDVVSYRGARRGAGVVTFWGQGTDATMPAHDGFGDYRFCRLGLYHCATGSKLGGFAFTNSRLGTL